MLDSEWLSSEPPGVRPVKGTPVLRIILGAVLGVALVLAAFFAPIPVFYRYLPGPVRNIERLVSVEDARTYSSEGSLLLTTVSLDPRVTFVEMIESQFDDSTAIVMKDDVTGGQSLDKVIEEQRNEMEESKQHAQEVALAALGFGHPTGDGARVTETVARSPAEGFFKPGDVIIEIDGQPVETTCDVGRLIDQHEIGDEVDVVVQRGGEKLKVQVPTAENPEEPGAPFIGVFMEDVNYRFNPGIVVDVETGKIGGPSGGLMMTLAIYDLLTPDDITGGRKVAGTGTISCDGGVGPIGGVQQKVAGAERAGAEIFLAPAANYADAVAVAGDIEVVKVSTFSDAVDYLEGLS
jgi:PDZ domain-containing protein